jgi:hypothetical protein
MRILTIFIFFISKLPIKFHNIFLCTALNFFPFSAKINTLYFLSGKTSQQLSFLQTWIKNALVFAGYNELRDWDWAKDFKKLLPAFQIQVLIWTGDSGSNPERAH